MEEKNNSLTLMAVHAHPDDECIGTGGILAKYSSQGVRTVVVYGTRGEAGEILNTDFVPPAPDLRIEEIRADELKKALKVLGVDSAQYLEYRDSGLNESPENMHPDAFALADLEEGTGRLVEIIRRDRPQVIVTYNDKGVYGHPDHIMANRVTFRAFQVAGDPEYNPGKGLDPWRPAKLYYTALPRARMRMMFQMAKARGEEPTFDPEVMGTPEEEITTTIDATDYLSKKFEALFCHQSQIGKDSFFRRIPEEWKKEAFGYEHFVCVDGCSVKDGKETDLFEGLR